MPSAQAWIQGHTDKRCTCISSGYGSEPWNNCQLWLVNGKLIWERKCKKKCQKGDILYSSILASTSFIHSLRGFVAFCDKRGSQINRERAEMHVHGRKGSVSMHIENSESYTRGFIHPRSLLRTPRWKVPMGEFSFCYARDCQSNREGALHRRKILTDRCVAASAAPVTFVKTISKWDRASQKDV